jgi:SPW repeat
MPRGPIGLRTHALLEPLAAIVLIAGPWLFGFDDIESLTIVSVAAGAVMLLSGGMTRWRWSMAKVIPLREHFMTDMLLGIVLILAPFVAGWSERGDATRFLVILGAMELLAASLTNWDEAEELAPRHRETDTAARAH